MFDNLPREILKICNDNFSSSEDKIKSIKSTIEQMVLESEKEATVPKSLKNQIKAVEKFFSDMDKEKCEAMFGKLPFPPKIYTDDNKFMSDGSRAYFGTSWFMFMFERKGEILKYLDKNLFVDGSVDRFQKIDHLFLDAFKVNRNFKCTITYPEVMAAKKMANTKYHYPFWKDVNSITDSNDIIKRVFNGYTFIRIFKILGVNSIDCYMSDNYKEHALIKGYNDIVGDYVVLSTFSNAYDALSYYDKEYKNRKSKIELIEKSRKEIIEKGKRRKLKFTRLENSNMPTDEDFPF